MYVYSFDPVYENDCADEAALLATAQEDEIAEAIAAISSDEPVPSYIEQAITRTAEGHIVVDMAALVNALRKGA